MSDSELIERIAKAVADRMAPPLPIDIQLWNGKAIAAYLHRSPAVVMERVVTLSSFPRQIRLPAQREGSRGQPLWKALEVIEWTESHQEKHLGRPRRDD